MIVRTFQARLHGDYPALDDLADRYQRARRTVYGKSSLAGRSFDAFKTEICAEFGLPGRLFTAQHQRDDNGYGTHAEWLDDWRAARGDQFMGRRVERRARRQPDLPGEGR